jgi:hypothetical protein
MTRDELISAGFKRWPPNNGDYCTDLYQRCITRDGKRLYFINVYRWQFPTQHQESYQLVVDFYTPDRENFKLKRQVENLDDALKFCAEVYERMGCIPDCHNQR